MARLLQHSTTLEDVQECKFGKAIGSSNPIDMFSVSMHLRCAEEARGDPRRKPQSEWTWLIAEFQPGAKCQCKIVQNAGAMQIRHEDAQVKSRIVQMNIATIFFEQKVHAANQLV